MPGNPYQMESDAGSVRSAAGSVHADFAADTTYQHGQLVNAISELQGRMDRMGLEAANAVADLQAGLNTTREEVRSATNEATRNQGGRPAGMRNTVRIPKPPKFRGVREGPRIMEWVHQATSYLRAAELEDSLAGMWHITNFFDGDAAVWWRLECERNDRGELAFFPRTWNELKPLLLGQFRIFNHVTDIRDRYTALRQTGSVSSYITKFRALVVELDHEPEQNQIYQFLKGLKPEIQARTRTHKPDTLAVAMDIADEADRANYHAYRGATAARRDGYARAPHGGGGSGGPAPMDVGVVSRTRNTGQGWDEERDQSPRRRAAKVSAVRMRPPTPYEMQRLRQENKCFYCRKEGHAARDCMKKKADQKRRTSRKTGNQPRRKAEN